MTSSDKNINNNNNNVISNASSHSSTYKHKEQLYNLFYELKSEIQGCKIEIDEEEYEDNVRSITFSNIFKYVRDCIQILLKTKNDTIHQLTSKLQLTSSSTTSRSDVVQYEALLRNAESKQRKLLRRVFMHRLQREAMENKISDYVDMEAEYEEMKTKYKYEDGRFLNNDRKDNEIYILRSENSKLKKEIVMLECKVKALIKENKEIMGKMQEKEKECVKLASINMNLQSDRTVYNNGNVNSSACCNKKIISQTHHCESSPQLKLNPTTFINLTTNNNSNNNNNNIQSKYIHIDSDKTKSDFLIKYFSQTQKKAHHHHHHPHNNNNTHSISNSAISNIKITRLPLGHLTNRSNNNNNNTNSQIPPINQLNINSGNNSISNHHHHNNNNSNSNHFGINNVNSYRQLFKNSSAHNIGCYPLSANRKQQLNHN